MAKEFIYLIRGGPYYKIGRTKNLELRIKSLQTGHPCPLQIIKVWLVEDGPSMEIQVHGQFLSKRIHGDWFNLSDADVEVLKAMGGEDVVPFGWKSNGLSSCGRKPKARTEQDRLAHPLLQWRERYRVSQADIEEACGISQTFVSKVENGERVPLRETLERLRQFTGLPTDAFIRPYHFLREVPNFMAYTRPPHGIDATHAPPTPPTSTSRTCPRRRCRGSPGALRETRHPWGDRLHRGPQGR